MSDCNEGDGETAAKEQDKQGGQAISVVNSEWHVLQKEAIQ